jgi:hypothetical protein
LNTVTSWPTVNSAPFATVIAVLPTARADVRTRRRADLCPALEGRAVADPCLTGQWIQAEPLNRYVLPGGNNTTPLTPAAVMAARIATVSSVTPLPTAPYASTLVAHQRRLDKSSCGELRCVRARRGRGRGRGASKCW